MKAKILLLLSCLLFTFARTNAQTPGILYGTLIDNYQNMNPSPNHQVKLKTFLLDSLGNFNFVLSDSTYSDNTGAFSFNTYMGVNNYHDVSIIDCNGNYQSQGYVSSPGSSLFIETCNNNSSCSATLSFVIDSTNTSTVHFSCPELANASSYTIHFGDGSSSNNSLTHNYATNDLLVGVYATISVVFQNGCVGYGYAFVMNVNQVNCYNYFSYQQMGVSNDIQFTSSASSSNVSYLWDFGDGSTDTTTNPIHNYAPNQNYLVSLTTTDQSGCNYSSHAMIYVYDICGVNITSYQMFDTTLTVQFYPLSNFYQAIDSNSSVTWNFGDGSPINTNFYPTHTFATVGTYNVCLNVVSNSGCNTNTCSNVTVYDYTTACSTHLSTYQDITNSNDFSFTVVPSIPNNAFLTTTGQSSIDFGDGTTQSFPLDTFGFCGFYNVIHTYNTSGTYIVTATTTNSMGCISTDYDTITVVMPAAYNCDLYLQTTAYNSLVSAYASSYSINIVNYAWDFGDGTTENNLSSSIYHVYNALGDYQVCLTSTAANGCSSTSCDSVTISSYGSISGYTNTMYLSPDTNYPSFIKVILIEQVSDSSSETSTVNVVAAQNTGSYYGYYQFDNVPPGNYTLLSVAYRDSAQVDTNFVPTYYVNAQHWEDADNTVTPSPFWSPYYLNLLPTAYVSGAGEIGGFIGDGVFKSSNNALAKVHVIIYNENEQAVKHVLTNAQGRYSFKGLSAGTYHIYPEVVGKPTYRATVTIGEDEMSNMDVNFMVGDAVVASVPIAEKNSIKAQVFPNPAKDVIHFVNDNTKIIRIIDVTGKLMYADSTIRNSNYSVSMIDFAKGIYFYQIETNNGNTLTGKFIKE